MKGKGNRDEDMWPRILYDVEILVDDTATVCMGDEVAW